METSGKNKRQQSFTGSVKDVQKDGRGKPNPQNETKRKN